MTPPCTRMTDIYIDTAELILVPAIHVNTFNQVLINDIEKHVCDWFSSQEQIGLYGQEIEAP